MPVNKFRFLIAISLMLAVTLLVISFKNPAGGYIRGNVTPPGVALRAFLFSGKDTLSVNVTNDAFQFSNVAAGNYKLLIEAMPPYRNAVKEGLRVSDGAFTDAGQIELQK